MIRGERVERRGSHGRRSTLAKRREPVAVSEGEHPCGTTAPARIESSRVPPELDVDSDDRPIRTIGVPDDPQHARVNDRSGRSVESDECWHAAAGDRGELRLEVTGLMPVHGIVLFVLHRLHIDHESHLPPHALLSRRG